MTFGFRPIAPSDYALFARWLAEPHVQKWWRESATVEHVAKNYDGDGGKTNVFVVILDDAPIGMIQSFWRANYPEDDRDKHLPNCVGIDYFVGEPDLIGKGLGTAMIKAFVSRVKHDFPGASGILTDPETANPASIRILEKAGFSKGGIVPGEHGPEQLMMLKF